MISKEELDLLKFELQRIKSDPFCQMEQIYITFQKMVRIADLNVKIAEALLDGQNKTISGTISAADWNNRNIVFVNA